MNFYDNQINFISPQAKLLEDLLEQINFQYSSDEDKLTNYQKLIDDKAYKIASGLKQYKEQKNNLLFLQTSFGLLFETAKNKRLSRSTQNNGSGESKFLDKYHDVFFATRLKILIKTHLRLCGDEADLNKLKDLFKTSISGNALELREDFNLIFNEYTQEQTEKTKNISRRNYFQNNFNDLPNFFEFDRSLKLHDLKGILHYDDKIKNPQSEKKAKDFEFEAHKLLVKYLEYVTSPSDATPTLDPKIRELLPFIDEHRRAFNKMDQGHKDQLSNSQHQKFLFLIKFYQQEILKDFEFTISNSDNQRKESDKLLSFKNLLFFHDRIQNPLSTKKEEDFEIEAHELLVKYLRYVSNQPDLTATLDPKTRELLPFIDEHRRAFTQLSDSDQKKLKANFNRQITINNLYIYIRREQDKLKIQLQPLNIVESDKKDFEKDLLFNIRNLLSNHYAYHDPENSEKPQNHELEAHELLCNYLNYVTSQSKEEPALDEKTRELLPFIDEHRRDFVNMDEKNKEKLKEELRSLHSKTKYLNYFKKDQRFLKENLEPQYINLKLRLMKVFSTIEDSSIIFLQSLLYNYDKYQNPKSTKKEEDFEFEAHELFVEYLGYVTNPSDATSTLDPKIRELLPFIDKHRRDFENLDLNAKENLKSFHHRASIRISYYLFLKQNKIDLKIQLQPENVVKSLTGDSKDELLKNIQSLLLNDYKYQEPLSTKKEEDFELEAEEDFELEAEEDFEIEARELLVKYLEYVSNQSDLTPTLDPKTRELLPFIDEHREAFSTLDESTKQQLTSFHFSANQNLLEKLLDSKNIQNQQSNIPEFFDKAQQLLEKLLILDNQINPPIKTDTYKSKPDFKKTAKDLLMTYLEALLSNDRSIINFHPYSKLHQYSKFFKKLDLDKNDLDSNKIKEITEYFLDKKQYKLPEICHGFLVKPHSQRMLRISVLEKKITECKSKLEKNSNDKKEKAFEYITLYSLYEAMNNRPSDLYLLKARTFFKAFGEDFKFYIDKTKYSDRIKKLFQEQFSKLQKDYDKILPILASIPEDEQEASSTLPRDKISIRDMSVRDKWRALAETGRIRSKCEVSNMK